MLALASFDSSMPAGCERRRERGGNRIGDACRRSVVDRVREVRAFALVPEREFEAFAQANDNDPFQLFAAAFGELV